MEIIQDENSKASYGEFKSLREWPFILTTIENHQELITMNYCVLRANGEYIGYFTPYGIEILFKGKKDLMGSDESLL